MDKIGFRGSYSSNRACIVGISIVGDPQIESKILVKIVRSCMRGRKIENWESPSPTSRMHATAYSRACIRNVETVEKIFWKKRYTTEIVSYRRNIKVAIFTNCRFGVFQQYCLAAR